MPQIGRRVADDAALSAVPQSAEVRRLREERLRLAELVAERTWDLGGLTYEMAIRDHFRVDVLARRAAELQELESELSEVERLLAHAGGVGGTCRYCGSPHARGAAYCWRCGHSLGTPQAASLHPHVVDAVRPSPLAEDPASDAAEWAAFADDPTLVQDAAPRLRDR